MPDDVKEKAREQAQQQVQADQLQRQTQALTDLLDALPEHYGDDMPPETDQQIEEIQQQANRLKVAMQAATVKADQLRSECQTALDQNASQIAAAMNRAAANAREQADEAATFVRGFSLAAGSEEQAVAPETARLGAEPGARRVAQVASRSHRVGRLQDTCPPARAHGRTRVSSCAIG